MAETATRRRRVLTRDIKDHPSKVAKAEFLDRLSAFLASLICHCHSSGMISIISLYLLYRSIANVGVITESHFKLSDLYEPLILLQGSSLSNPPRQLFHKTVYFNHLAKTLCIPTVLMYFSWPGRTGKDTPARPAAQFGGMLPSFWLPDTVLAPHTNQGTNDAISGSDVVPRGNFEPWLNVNLMAH